MGIRKTDLLLATIGVGIIMIITCALTYVTLMAGAGALTF